MLDESAVLALFDEFERSVLRLESRAHTDIESERAEMRAFLADDLPEQYVGLPDSWTAMVTRQTSAGKLFRRVRVMDEPLTDYNRFMIYCGRWNLDAGEDIRYLSRSAANGLDLPDHDFWVFDSVRMTELQFTADGRFLGHDLLTDPEIVSRHEQWIDVAWAAAVPAVDYVADDPTRAWPPIRLTATKGMRTR